MQDPSISTFLAGLFETIAAGGLHSRNPNSNPYPTSYVQDQLGPASYSGANAILNKDRQKLQGKQRVFAVHHAWDWPKPRLTRFDLFHAHLFIPNAKALYDPHLEDDWHGWEAWLEAGAGAGGSAEGNHAKGEMGDNNGSSSSSTTNSTNSSSSGRYNYSSNGDVSSRDTWPSPSCYSSSFKSNTTAGSKPASSSSRRGGSRVSGDVGPSVGLLFHAAEYPAYDEEGFPIYLGYCQNGSDLVYHQRRMDVRNIIWYQVRETVGERGPVGKGTGGGGGRAWCTRGQGGKGPGAEGGTSG